MTRYEIDPRLKAEKPDRYMSDLIKPLLKFFENQDGDMVINEIYVRSICKDLREIYHVSQDWEEALSQARWNVQKRHDDQILLAAIEDGSVLLFPKSEEDL